MTIRVMPDLRLTHESPESVWRDLTGHDALIAWSESGRMRMFQGVLQSEEVENYALVHMGIIRDYSIVNGLNLVSMNPGDPRIVRLIHTKSGCVKCDRLQLATEEEKES